MINNYVTEKCFIQKGLLNEFIEDAVLQLSRNES